MEKSGQAIQTPSAKIKPGNTAASALVGIWNVSLAAFIFATLYIAQDLLIPLALAALLTFLLAPVVTRLERYIGRVSAVLLVVSLIVAGTGVGGWILTRQLVDLANRLPDYKENIRSKLRSFDFSGGGRFKEISKTVEELKKDLPGAEAPEVAQKQGDPSTAEVNPSGETTAVPVEVVNTSEGNPFDLVQGLIAPLLGPLGTAGLVLLLLIFMLLKREDLRSRMIRLIGQGRISSTTKAMDDAGARVARYLLMQLVVNVSYGIPVAIGLYFIGVPNAVLWGASATLLRFIPYVGPWIGAAIPTALSLAVSPGWQMPLLTISLFIVLELISNNVLEPWLYGSSTGVSPVALIVAAVSWTWLWGPVGLVLATPLTVCLVVMGRHIPRLSFLSVLLSAEEALTPAEDFYHRLLTTGEQDEIELVESYLKENSLAQLYDTVMIPVITAIERDHRLENLDDQQRSHAEQSLRDIVEDLGVSLPTAAGGAPEDAAIPLGSRPTRRVLCLPARAPRDELACEMLGQLLRLKAIDGRSISGQDTEALIRAVQQAGADAVCISVVAPSTVLHARYLCLKLKSALPKQRVVVGLWGVTEQLPDTTRRLRDSGADEVVTTLEQAVCIMAAVPLDRGEGARQTPSSP